MHALVDQLAAARARRLGAPLAVVAEPPAVPVAAAHVQQLAVPPECTSATARASRRVEAVVEADLDEPPACARPLGEPVDSARRRARPASRPARARPPRARARASRASAIVRTSRRPRRPARARAARRASAHARPPNRRDESAAPPADRRRSSRRARRRPSASARLRPISAAADDPDAERRRAAHSVTCTRRRSALELEVEGELRRARRRHRLARVLRAPRVDEQEAAAAGADELAADDAAAARERVERVDPLRRHARRAAALVLPVLVHQLGVGARGRPHSSSAAALVARSPSCGGGSRASSSSPASCARPGRRGSRTRSAPRRCRRAGGCRAACASVSARARAARRRRVPSGLKV